MVNKVATASGRLAEHPKWNFVTLLLQTQAS